MTRIAGIVGKESAEHVCKEMLTVAASRKTSNFSIEAKAGYAIGDVGKCPHTFSYQDGSVLAYDGLFYNLNEISNKSGFLEWFYGSYRQSGFRDTIIRINGDFSLAFYDAQKAILWIARDRIGLRPLYYNLDKAIFTFASRPASLFIPGLVEKKWDRDYVARYAGCHYRYIDNVPNASAYDGIHQLPAGHILKYDNKVLVEKYWDINNISQRDISEKEAAEEYRNLFLDAVNRRISVTQNRGFTLSGGMDSSSVLASTVYLSQNKQEAYSTVYEDKTYDESEEIETILDSCVSTWNKIKLPNEIDLLSTISEMIEINDEPLATATWLSHYLLLKEISKKNIDYLFGGLGGDELNAGEYEYFFYNFADLLATNQSDLIDNEISCWQKHHDHPVFIKNRELALEYISKNTDSKYLGVCLPEQNRLHRYTQVINKDFYDLANFRPVMKNPYTSYLKNRTFQDIFYETSPCCLRAEDRHCKNFGIENVLPFFDYRLVEFMFSMPNSFKIRDGVTKVLLREAMKGILPDSTRNRIKKTGWNAPAHLWFSGSGLSDLRDLIHSKKFKERGIYDLGKVELLMDEHEEIVKTGAIKENHMMFLWQLANLELWLGSF